MTLIANPDTGEVQYRDSDGQFKPAKVWVNPDTKQVISLDPIENKLVPINVHSQGMLGFVDDAVRAIASGMTFGYADEFAAKMGELTGVGGKKGDYEGNIARERARDAGISSYVRVPGEIAGTVASTIAAGPLEAAAGVAKLPALARGAVSGATVGALSGSGNADDGLSNRLEGAAEGGVAGAVLGTALAGVGRVISHVRSPEAMADREITRAIDRDSGLNNLPSVRENITTLADQGGENVKGLLERVSQTPGAGRTDLVPYLTERQNTQLSRITQDLKSLTGTETTAVRATEDQMAKRTADARPLYEKAYDEGDKPIWSNEIERLTAVPEVQSAMRSAVTGWQRSQIANGYGAMNPGAMVDAERGGIIKFTNGRVPVFPNLQFWDYTKNALDDMIAAEIKLDGSITKKGRDLTIIVGKLRDQLDGAVDGYKAAREAWAGPSAYLNALKLGKNIKNVSAEEMAATFGSLSGAEQEAFRVGALSEIFRGLGSKGTKLADLTTELRSPEMRGKISNLMPTQEAAAKWHQALEFEIGSSEMVGRALKGSPTARRLFEAQDGESIAGDLVHDAFRGNVPGIFAKLVSSTAGKLRDTIRSRTDAAIAERLMQKSE